MKEGLVTVKVGPQQQQYRIHQTLITHHSEYFRIVFNGSWKEADENSVTLEDIELATFDIFVHWLYTQNMPSVGEVIRILESYPRDQGEEENTQLLAITKSIVLGDRFLSPAFQRAASNAVVDYVLDYIKFQDMNLLSAAKYAFENLPEDSAINRFFLEAHCQYLGFETEERLVDEIMKKEMPQMFLLKLIARFSTKEYSETGGWGRKWHRCEYYEYADDQDQIRCTKRRACEACEHERREKPEWAFYAQEE